MKSTTVARNYAQALLLAADAHGMAAVERYGQLMEAVAGAVQADERISVALESPRVSKAVKAALLERALEEVAPPEFVRFLQAVVRRGRQGLLGEIAQQYDALVDVKLNRVDPGPFPRRSGNPRRRGGAGGRPNLRRLGATQARDAAEEVDRGGVRAEPVS